MTLEVPGTLAAPLVPELDVSLQMQWAVFLASSRKLDLLVFHWVESTEERVAEVPLQEPPEEETEEFVREVIRLIEESPKLRAGPRESAELGEEEEHREEDVIYVRFKRIYFPSLPSLRRLLLDEVVSNKIDLFTVAREQISDLSNTEFIKERRLFLRYVPCEVVFCLGLEKENPLSRILVATGSGPTGRAALRLGNDLAVSVDGTLTALHVNPDVGLDAERVGERRLDRHLKKALGSELAAINRRVVVDDQVQGAVRRVWEEGQYDLVVMGAPRVQIERSLGAKLGKEVTVALVREASPIYSRFREFVEEGIQLFVPQIEREERVALVDRLQSSAAWNFDFISLMVLSTTIAAIGLIQNSAAVVIGAMLVAPLMTPLLGLGLALVQGNYVLARLSIQSVTWGLCVSLLCGFLVGLFTPSLVEPTREMLARGGPGILDLFVAFASGLAAAYASSRPGLIAALPGVAIAAALVPPIATSGLALSLGNFPLAFGALILFIINMVTIILATMAGLWAVGLRNLKKTSRWTVIAGSTIIVAVLALGVYLSLQPRLHELTKEMPAALVKAVQESLGTNYRFESLAVAYDELGVQLNVLVVGKTPAPEKLAANVRNAASNHFVQPDRVRLLTRIAIEINPVEQTSRESEKHK